MGEISGPGEHLSLAELESELALELPARDLMSLININLAVVNGINISGAMNVLTQGSSAASAAMQQISLGQFV
jgi:hypothetical protein